MQTGLAAAFHRALDADVAQGEAEQKEESKKAGGAESTPARERVTSERELKETRYIQFILIQPLSCKEIPDPLKEKRVIDYLKYHIQYGPAYANCK